MFWSNDPWMRTRHVRMSVYNSYNLRLQAAAVSPDGGTAGMILSYETGRYNDYVVINVVRSNGLLYEFQGFTETSRACNATMVISNDGQVSVMYYTTTTVYWQYLHLDGQYRNVFYRDIGRPLRTTPAFRFQAFAFNILWAIAPVQDARITFIHPDSTSVIETAFSVLGTPTFLDANRSFAGYDTLAITVLRSDGAPEIQVVRMRPDRMNVHDVLLRLPGYSCGSMTQNGTVLLCRLFDQMYRVPIPQQRADFWPSWNSPWCDRLLF